MDFDTWWEQRPLNDRLMHLHGDRATYTEQGWNAGAGAERVRIRRELLEEIGGLTHFVEWRGCRAFAVNDPWISAADIRAALDRICPEEGQAK